MVSGNRTPGAARLVLLAAGAAALIVAAGGVALAADSGAAGSAKTISGCYTTHTGALRVLTKADSKCGKGETAISWSKQGPAGPKGSTGKRGPAGAVAGYSVSVSDVAPVAVSDTHFVKVLSLQPPVGDYIVTAAITGKISDIPDSVTCQLLAGTGLVAQNQTSISVDPNDGTGLGMITITDSAVTSGKALTVRCEDENAMASVVSGAMTAIPVTAVNP
jgi:hypothetical protein